MDVESVTLSDSDLETTFRDEVSWNHHTLTLLTDPILDFVEHLPSHTPPSLLTKALSPIDQAPPAIASAVEPIFPHKPQGHSDWAAAKLLTNHYLQTLHKPKEIPHSANVITGSISLQDLLSPDYFRNPIIPFTIPAESLVVPASLFALPPEFVFQTIPLPADLHAFSELYARSQPLPEYLLKSRGVLSKYGDEYYVKIQSEYYDQLQADCYNKLLAAQQAQIAASQVAPLTIPLPEFVAPPVTVDLHAIAKSQALATPLPPDLVRPPGHRGAKYYYTKGQADFYAKVEAECYAKLLAEQQAQISAAQAATLPVAEPEIMLPDPLPSSNQQFVSFIEGKLAELKSPAYLEQFSKPPYNEQFVAQLESRLGEVRDLTLYMEQYKKSEVDYLAGIRAIEAYYLGREITSPQFPFESPDAPFFNVPLLGDLDQRTVHFHCGISNTLASVIEGGICLGDSLENKFAIQPHLIHQRDVLKGLSYVTLESFGKELEVVLGGLVGSIFLDPLELPKTLLENSQIQQSISYEVANLTMIAQNIINSGNANLKQLHVTFSNGGYVFREALKQLSPECQQTIIVITAGTTAIIEDQLACKVYNIVGKKDLGSQSCNRFMLGIEKANADVEVIPQGDTKFGIGGHFFMQDEYQDRISEIIQNEVEKTYEIY